MVRLGDIATVVTGSTPKTSVEEYWNGTNCWITPAELSDKVIVVHDTERKVTDLAISDTSLKPLPIGTVLLSSRAPIGKVAITGCVMYCNQGFKNLVCGERIYNKYLFWFLRGRTEYLNSLGRGVTFKEISKTIVEGIRIPLPPFDIQKHIADTLDKTQEIIDGHKKQLAELDNLIKSFFYEMFGDPVTNEKHWDQKKLSMLSSLVSGGTPSREFPEYFNGDIPWITTVALGKLFISDEDAVEYITEDAVENSATKKIPPGSVLFGVRVGVGKVAINLVEMCTNQDVVAITDIDKRLNNIFLMETLKKYSRLYSSQQRGATIKGITSKILQDTLIPIPPFDLQNKFADIVTKIEEQKILVKQAITESEHLFNSLMSEYFD